MNRVIAYVGFLPAIAIVHCSGGTATVEPACSPGDETACVCAGGMTGTKVCSDASQWGSCGNCAAGDGGLDAGIAGDAGDARGCASDQECPTGSACNTAAGLCVPSATGACTGDSECTVPDTCGGAGIPSVCGHPDPNATTDVVPRTGAFGARKVPPSADIIALGSGAVILSDRKDNAILIVNAFTGTTLAKYPLASAPGDLSMDPAGTSVYAGQGPATKISRVGIATGAVSEITLDIPSVAVAGGDGVVFAADDEWSVAIIDPVAGTRRATVKTDFFHPNMLAFDGAGNRLFVGQGSDLSRFVYDPGAPTLTLDQNAAQAGDNCRDLALSPDGRHVALSCGGGSSGGYTILDRDAGDLDQVFGQWDTGAYPAGVAFSRDGRRLVATNTSEVIVFDTASYVKVRSFTVDFKAYACGYDNLFKVAVSPAGRVVFGLATCGFDRDEGLLFWAAL